MISGVKRKTTAVESTFRFFQTVDLIISHFKREADRNKIFELTSQDTNFKDLLIATATIHIYHNLGLKVQNTLDSNKFTFDSTRKLELSEKGILIEEVGTLLKNSFSLEISLLNKRIDLENRFLSYFIEVRKLDLQKLQKEKMIKERTVDASKVRTDLGRGEVYRCTLISKIICLIVNKIASLDPEGVGVEMEADKPGWCDALNGLPGILGSSINESAEIKRLALILLDIFDSYKIDMDRKIKVPEEVFSFLPIQL